MSELQKIDCHTHIVNREIYSQYCRSSGCGDYALVMEFLPHMAKENMPDKSWSLCDGSERLFLCPSVDIHGDIPKQLKEIEKSAIIIPRENAQRTFEIIWLKLVKEVFEESDLL